MFIQAAYNPPRNDISTIRQGLADFNLTRAPALMNLPDDDFAVIARDAQGKIIAGAVGEFDWGYLYVDTLWVAADARGNGYATRIMQAAESSAAIRGIAHAYLFTTSFQARPFYEKIGYRVFAQVAERPRGHTTYYMVKDALQPAETEFEIQIPPQPADMDSVDNGLLDDIAQHVPLIQERYGVFLRDGAGTIHGGLLGGFYWDWFDLRFFWITDSLRGQGFGKQMLDILLRECQRRDCVGISCDTASFQTLPFYRSQGFEIVGILEDRPPGYRSYYLRKLLG